MTLRQLGVQLLRFKLARRRNSYFELNNVCTFESKELTKHSNNVFVVGKMINWIVVNHILEYKNTLE